MPVPVKFRALSSVAFALVSAPTVRPLPVIEQLELVQSLECFVVLSLDLLT